MVLMTNTTKKDKKKEFRVYSRKAFIGHIIPLETGGKFKANSEKDYMVVSPEDVKKLAGNRFISIKEEVVENG